MTEPPFPVPPQKPEPYECCERGCSPCIFDYYYDALERWEERLRELGVNPADYLAG
ncbi:hypothetical protein FHS31_000514 [Sphingomonas vulcanisoli]|uniref:Oxidoreductase-like domain-containing protein n=1 Tax=Sphingomonas vulcanisoli TaxID=1658060 RepID=A0ABX0TN46_9SPHN|nr:oxidoreductase-like domain-containing protein [Sphingomonas vulcanisoli]NIJ06932.1 hypothetical protein [Sphingomonas vulcanisoli]